VVTVKRITACIVVLLSSFVAPPARAQTSPGSGPSWSPREVRPAESAGEIVLKFTTTNAGRWVYYTEDGDCPGYPSAEDPANQTPLSPAECGRPFARASEDYGAVRGEWIFTEGGSRTIRIPIIDDDVDEPDGEAFAVNASRYDDVAGMTVWHNAYIRIVDDDPRDDGDAPPPGVITTVTRSEPRAAGSSRVDTGPPPAPVPARRAPAPTTVESPPPDLEVARRSGELQPGGDLEFATGEGPLRERDRPDVKAGSAFALALALGTAAAAGLVLRFRRGDEGRRCGQDADHASFGSQG
jgi:hypothetical protein